MLNGRKLQNPSPPPFIVSFTAYIMSNDGCLIALAMLVYAEQFAMKGQLLSLRLVSKVLCLTNFDN